MRNWMLGLWIVAIVSLQGCGAGGIAADLAEAVDLAPSVDLAPPAPDLVVGPTCGTILLCVVARCGFNDLACAQTCATGASSTEFSKAGALGLCAAQHCVNGSAPSPGPALFQCLQAHCAKELADCDGLSF